jgi:hypothetical protein
VHWSYLNNQYKKQNRKEKEKMQDYTRQRQNARQRASFAVQSPFAVCQYCLCRVLLHGNDIFPIFHAILQAIYYIKHDF